MSDQRIRSLAIAGLVSLSIVVACSDDSTDDDGSGGTSASAGSGGKDSSAAGTSSKAGSAGNSHAGSGGSAGSGKPVAGAGGVELGGEGGSDAGSPGLAGAPNGGQGEAGAASGGEAGSGGDTSVSCETTRTMLLSPIAAVSTGTVEVTSAQNATTITLKVDASAGGFMAAATNPYIYLSLANKAAVAITDVAADTSNAWDIALKRDNIRSNGGDSGSANGQVAVLATADFAAVTAGAAASAEFGQDQFVDPLSCLPVLDGFGKPFTRFNNWYDYTQATMTLAPAAKVYLVRAANGTSLYKVQITGYYADVPNGQGGTVKKSAVYSLKYEALQ